jgi:xanthine dehydrogenase accessory factor
MISALPGPADWIDAALDCIDRRQRAVLAMVTDERGSTPRDSGSWMLLTKEAALGTIGGGELERTLVEAARAMLEGAGTWSRAPMQCALGPDMRQCCGGVVQVLLEPIGAGALEWLVEAQQQLALTGHVRIAFDSADREVSPVISTHDTLTYTLPTGIITLSFQETRPRLALFGAGHVGRALCTVASQLPIRVTVFDARPDQCTQVPEAANIRVDENFDPVLGAQQLHHYEAALVMTHSHALDYDVCRILLRRPDLVYTGLIGSESKSRRFRKALRKDGLHDLELARLTSPIGKNGPVGKEPGVIALSVLSEILTACQAAQNRQRSYNTTTTPLNQVHHG